MNIKPSMNAVCRLSGVLSIRHISIATVINNQDFKQGKLRITTIQKADYTGIHYDIARYRCINQVKTLITTINNTVQK